MKKLLLSLGIIGTLAMGGVIVGGQTLPNVPTELQLKAPKEKVLSSENKTETSCLEIDKVLKKCKKQKTEAYVEYEYISTEKETSHTVRFEEGKDYSNSEFLNQRPDGKQPIAFYAENKWYKESDGVKKIKKATTTPEVFVAMTKQSVPEKLAQWINPNAYAATSYTTTGTFTPIGSGTIEILVIGGGGGGGAASGAGGGAGGYQYNSSFSVNAQTYSVTVGTGGQGGHNNTNGSNGDDSVFDTITAYGGGFGAGSSSNGGNGGCGGGGDANGKIGGTGSQGQNGGGGRINGPGGGGGTSTIGGTGSTGVGGNGGDGTSNSITGSSVVYGGGGAGAGTPTLGNPGNGGGGSASNDTVSGTPGGQGTNGLGGGGGGGPNFAGGTQRGGSGGSGIIIIVDNTTLPASDANPFDTTIFE